MPELPDINAYVDALNARIQGEPLRRIRLKSPFVLRSVDPAIATVFGKRVLVVSRIGKRLSFAMEDDLFLVIHLMIAGRLQWKTSPDAALSGRNSLLAFDFPMGTLLLTEASTKHRASLHLVAGREALAEFSRGGIEPLECTFVAFYDMLKRENHTLKRTLTDPTLISGIGNAYSDEILHRAKLSPILLTGKIYETDAKKLYDATRSVLSEWCDRLGKEAAKAWPAKVTAFRKEMTAHGRYGEPCVICGSTIQRIAYASNETNYCATCQTGGKLLADRSLSKLMHEDWPKTLEELEERKDKLKKL